MSQKPANWCGTEEAMSKVFSKNPGFESDYLQELAEFNEFAREYDIQSRQTTIVIPTVVHVYHFNGAGNISEAQVLDGIRQINEDLKRLNADTTDTRNIFKPFAGSTNVEFRLAKKDPQGNCTNGIVRVNSGTTNSFGGQDALLSVWPNTQYFNIWIVNNIQNFTGGGGTILGYAYYPTNGNNPLYGLVNRNDAWGTIGNIVYQGRTPTHEVGHALNLPHTFNDGCGFDCNTSGDFVCDTPPASTPTQGCNYILNTCNNDTVGSGAFPSDYLNQIENYMSYDDCQNMFSQGQVNRMEAAIAFYNTLSSITAPSNLITTGVDDAYYFTAPPCSPIAEFGSNKKVHCAGGEIDFFDLSYNATLDSTWQWNWSFQGGTPATSTDRNPTVIFNQAGNYDVSLTVTNSQGTSPIETKSSYLDIIPGSGNFIGPVSESFSAVEFPSNNNDPTLAWRIEKPQSTGIGWERSTNAFFNGPASAYLNNFSITNEEFHSLVTPVADLTQMTQAFMNFRVAYARKSNEVEVMNIYASRDCGSTWRLITSQLSIYLYSTTWPSGSPFLPSDPGQWKPFTWNISQYAGEDNIMFKLEFKARGGNNIYLDEFEISDTPLNVSLDDGINGTKFPVIYPNPSSGSVHIEAEGIERIEIYDMLGNSVHLEELPVSRDKVSVDLSHLKKGIYFIKLGAAAQTTGKIILE
jgi:PKD repeat protein